MAMRVATFALNDRMFTASMKTQSRMAEIQLQQSTGQVSTSIGGYGAAGKSLVDIEVSIARSQAYVSAAKEASGRVEVMYSVMNTINDLLASFRVTLTGVQSTNSNEENKKAVSVTAAYALEELSTLLNTQYEGRYLFGGSATTTLPVDLANYNVVDPTVQNFDYYQGNNTLASVQVSAEQSINYGVAANEDAFEAAFRAFSMMSNANGVFTADDVTAALELMVKAVDGAAAVQGKLSVNAAAMERAINREEDFQMVFEENLSNIRDIDVTAVAVKLTAYEVQLQASYSTMAKLSNINLLDYLR